MPATITGMVFNDLNHNGKHEIGEPGIPNAFLTLLNTVTDKCTQTFTDANGIYKFSVDTAGNYKIYETVAQAGSCPPTTFTQPSGFSFSNGPRVLDVKVTHSQAHGHGKIEHQDFSHDALDDPLLCTTTMIQFVNTPTQWYNIDIVTGVSTLQGLLNPADNVNAISYNLLDHYIYGYDQTTNHIVRVDSDGNLTQLLPNPTGLPTAGYNVGAFDLAGHLFIMVNDTARFYTVDLTPNSPTFLKLVDPTNGFVEETSNFGTALSATLNVSDWAYNPNDGFLYGVQPSGNTARVMRVNPTTGTVTALTTTLPTLSPAGNSWGAVVMDASGTLYAIYNGNGGVFRFTIAGNTATGIRISTTFPTSFNDAAMCPEALIGPIADISVTKTGAPSPVSPGDEETFTIQVTNNGPDTAENVTLTDIVTAQIESPEYSLNGGVTFLPWPGNLNLGTFVSGASETVLIRGIVAMDTVGELVNTATVESDAEDSDPDNNISTIVVPVAELSADLAVSKSASPNPAQPGEQLTYTILVSNLGPDDAQNVTLTDAVSAEILNPQYSLNGVNFFPWTGSLSLGAFAPGESETVLIRGAVSGNASGAISNTAVVSSTTPDPNPNNNTSTVVVPVGEAADLAVVKSANSAQVSPGGTLTYTVVVSNFGPDAAQNVTLTDVIPADILGAEYSVNGGVTFLPWTGSLNLGAFAPGQSKTILIRGAVSSASSGILTNTAVVSSTTPDPNPENNTSTVVTFLCDARCQAITDLIESVALEEAGLAHILNAEGEKLQAMIAAPGVSADMLLQANRSVQSMASAVALLETILASKLSLFDGCICGNSSAQLETL